MKAVLVWCLTCTALLLASMCLHGLIADGVKGPLVMALLVGANVGLMWRVCRK